MADFKKYRKCYRDKINMKMCTVSHVLV